MSEWISVKDRLPERVKESNYSLPVICSDGKNIGIFDLFYHDEEKSTSWSECYYIGSNLDRDMISQWMPIQKPPEE